MNCNGPTAFNFIILMLIRGTTPLMMYFSEYNLNSASLVVALKCAITLAIFTLSAIWQYGRDEETRNGFKRSFEDKSIFWRLSVVGVLQSFAPYIFTIYSLRYIPPAIVGVFIVTIPWCGILMERLPFIKLRQKIPVLVKLGMFCGLVGICLILGPVINGSLKCPIPAHKIHQNSTNTSTLSSAVPRVSHYTCEKPMQLFVGTSALVLAPVLWGFASVFWKTHKKDTHTLVQSIGQNFIGMTFGLLMFGITQALGKDIPRSWRNTEIITSILYLGVLTGWLATLLVQYLYFNIGGKMTNQVLTGIPFIAFIEESILFHNVANLDPYIITLKIVGLLLVTGGVFISNLPSADVSEEENTRHGRSGSLSEVLIPNEGYESEGMDAGLNQVVEGRVHLYQPIHQRLPPDIDDENPPETEEEEVEINSPSEMRRTPFPKLTQVT